MKKKKLQRLMDKLLLTHTAQTPALSTFGLGLHREMISTEMETHPVFNSFKKAHKPFFLV